MYTENKITARENYAHYSQTLNRSQAFGAKRRVALSSFIAFALLSMMFLDGVRPAHGQTETILYEFQLGVDDGTNPDGGLVLGKKGNMYGATFLTGDFGSGGIYEVFADGGEVPLYSFNPPTDGASSQGSLAVDKSGNLYGANCAGGKFDLGTVYKLSPANVFTVLHNFTGKADGSCPTGSMVADAAGNLDGTAFRGGKANSGTIFKLTPAGKLTTIYAFAGGADGGFPQGGMALGAKGYLYGTTLQGGAFNEGTLFRVSLAGVHTVFWNFTGGADGSEPNGNVIFDKHGHICGTTLIGGDFGRWLIYVAWPNTLTKIYSFADSTDGALPGPVVRDKQGNLYGTTQGGGTNFLGTVFEVKLTPSVTKTILYSFTGGPNDGLGPTTGVILDQNGNLNGVTGGGGDEDCVGGCGVVYRITP
jgi:uncharacterized repeat protein (TIGR03803 family)